MRQTKFILTIFATILLMLTGCSRQNAEENLVYTSTVVWDNIGNSDKGFAAEGDNLYYLSQNSNYTHTLCKMPLADIDKITESTQEKTVLTIYDILSAIPAGELNLEMLDVADLMGDEKGTGERIAGDILDYAVDTEGGICCIAVLYGTNRERREYILYRQSPTGEMSYWMELPDSEAGFSAVGRMLALDGDGNIYVLTGKTILVVDEGGRRSNSLSMENELQPGQEIRGCLLEGEKGYVYYTVENTWNYTRETFILNETDQLRMTKVSKLSGHLDMGLFGASNGLLQASGEKLYRYHRADDSLTPILSWQYSNLQQSDIKEVVRVDGEHYFVSATTADGFQRKALLLTKAEGVYSERETIVVASLFPGSALKRSVAEFNQLSDKYFVYIESYGASIYGGDANEGAYVRLDSSLMSKNAPDILDLADLDIGKYAENGALEDLSAYLNGNAAGRINYLDNLLAGYTMEGRLVCIPRVAYFRPVFGISPETKSLESWTMPELIRLTEKHPDVKLFGRVRQADGYLLEEFCAPYYLERFIDWGRRRCSFDSEEFCALLDWIKKQNEKTGQEGNALLAMAEIRSFLDYLKVILEYGEDTVMLGYPSADGKGVSSAVAEEALAILSGSRHKEGAWEFLQYFLSEDTYGSGFPTRRELLDEMALEAVTPRYGLDEKGNPAQDEEGNLLILPKGNIYINGIPVEFYALEQEQADEVLGLIESADYTHRSAEAQRIVDIIAEEVQSFLDGSKSVEEVCSIIQNKVELLLQEQGS